MTTEEWWNRALGLGRAPLDCVPKADVPCWHGDATVRFRGRYTDGESDNDLYQYVRVRYRREDAEGWSGNAYIRISEDLDGEGDGDEFFVFDSIDDTYGTRVLSRLYSLYANYRSECGVVEQVRIGRQDVTAGDLFHVDGVHALFRPGAGATRLYAFGGIPSHLYESSVEGDWIVGVGATFEPWCRAGVEVSDVYIEDASHVYGVEHANLATVQVTQGVYDAGSVRAGFQMLNEDARVAWGSADLYSSRLDATFRGSFRTQISQEKAQAYDIDPYYAILLTLEPYWEATLSVSKDVGRCVTVEAGGQVRRLYDQDDEGDFNHDFSRVWATISATDWPAYGWTPAVTGEWWRTEDGDDVAAAGFELAWRPSDCFRASAGVDYSLYRTDLYAVDERFDSYGAYVRARWRSSWRWEWDGSLRVEDDDFDTVVTLNLAVRFEF